MVTLHIGGDADYVTLHIGGDADYVTLHIGGEIFIEDVKLEMLPDK